MSEKAHPPIFSHQHQHMRFVRQGLLRVIKIELIRQLRFAHDPAIALPLVHFGNAIARFKQSPSAQAFRQGMLIILAAGLAQLIDLIAPNLMRKFIANKRVVSLIIGRCDQDLIGR